VWNEWPPNEPIPGIPGSFGTLSGPVPSTTNVAVSRSPRLVSMTQQLRVSSQVSPVTSVWNSASRYRPNCLPMRRQCARIGGLGGRQFAAGNDVDVDAERTRLLGNPSHDRPTVGDVPPATLGLARVLG
jgi:hypothetical protein